MLPSWARPGRQEVLVPVRGRAEGCGFPDRAGRCFGGRARQLLLANRSFEGQDALTDAHSRLRIPMSGRDRSSRAGGRPFADRRLRWPGRTWATSVLNQRWGRSSRRARFPRPRSSVPIASASSLDQDQAHDQRGGGLRPARHGPRRGLQRSQTREGPRVGPVRVLPDR